MKQITLAQGGGGEQSNELIKKLFFKYFNNDILLREEDAAVLKVGRNIAFSTDAFTVSPLFFSGGNIGKLSIAGTVNDLSVMGAKPLYLTASFVIEEGFSYEKLEKIVKSMCEEMKKSGVKIVAGDTKVVPKGTLDGIFITTSGIGEIVKQNISSHNLKQGYKIIISHEVGNHGACILAAREELKLESKLKSDCSSLWHLVEALFENNIVPFAMRDATRGGLSAVLNEWAVSSGVCIELDEQSISVADEVKGLCEFLGFEPLELANEGTMVLCVKDEDVAKTLEILRGFEEGKNASLIGEVSSSHEGKVVLKTPWGSSRFLQAPQGELLPRIC